jgi:type VI protein secretion system component Hcp
LLTTIKKIGHSPQHPVAFEVFGEKINLKKLEDQLKVYAYDIALRASFYRGTIGKLLGEKYVNWEKLEEEVHNVMKDITALVALLEHLTFAHERSPLALKNVELITLQSRFSSSRIKAMFPGKKICVCDFYIDGCEHGTVEDTYIITFDDMLIIDHHSKLPQMSAHISSTTIAMRYVKKYGVLPPEYKILISHTDCDSILSMLVMRGLLPPEEKFSNAAIAADHTGEANRIGDLLQALERERDYLFSVRNLFALLHGGRMSAKAEALLAARLREREKIKELVGAGKFTFYHDIAYIILDEKVDGALVPALIPKANVIVVAYPMPAGSRGKWLIKVRVGKNARGIYLNQLHLPDFGGRWNAGSTSRSGGTNISPQEYVKLVYQKIC